LTEKTRLRFHAPQLPGREQLPVLLSCLLRFGCAFLFSGAAIRGQALPAALCLLTVPGPGLHGFSVLLGSCIGALLLWPVPTAAATIAAAVLIRAAVWIFRDSLSEIHPVFLPFLAALSYALSGGILMAADSMAGTAPEWYLMRILLCFCGSWLLRHMMEKPTRESVLLLIVLLLLSACGIAPLGLCAAIPLGIWLTLSAMHTDEGLTMAAVCGMALDLGRNGTAPMTAIFCLSSLLTAALPIRSRRLTFLAGSVPLLGGFLLTGTPHECFAALIGILAAGSLRKDLAPMPEAAERRPARPVRQMQQASGLLQELGNRLQEDLPPLPEPAPSLIFDRAADRVCKTCPQFSSCWAGSCEAYDALSGAARPMLSRGAVLRDDFPVSFLSRCRKIEALLSAINQELDSVLFRRQFRHRLDESRSLLAGQYRIFSSYLQAASETVQGVPRQRARCVPVLGMATAERHGSGICGDHGAAFRTARHLHYTVLCDGMGSGYAAMEESSACVRLLQGLLTAGFAPEDALPLLNSIYLMRDDGAFSTVDLLQTDLSTGKVQLWKWGSAPSYLLHDGELKKIGTALPPPGLEGTGMAERFELSLEAGDLLVLLSDGAAGAGTEEQIRTYRGRSPRELAARIIDQSIGEDDDRTAVVLRLQPIASQRQHTTNCA